MEIPAYQPFYLHSLAELRAESARLGVGIPSTEDLTALAAPLALRSHRIPNRLCAQPIAGGDAQADGAPGDLTRRRYRRYAEGRFGLIWIESTVAGSPEKPGQLALHRGVAPAFRAMAEEIHGSATEPPIIVLQLASTQPDSLIEAALLAAEAGFDGVDLQCPRDALPDVLAAVRAKAPGLLLATRLCAYEGMRGGFGVSAGDYRKPDLSEPIRFVQRLREHGLDLLNITSASPALRGPDRAIRGRADAEVPDEHPLMTLDRQLTLARALRNAAPGLPVIGSGFSWLRQLVPEVAAGALREGMIDFAGLGRGALAHPSLPAEIFANGRLEPGSACMLCQACSQLSESGEAVGCVLRDYAVYGPVYRQMRRFDADQLLAGAARCHLCEAAPCVAASPTHTDIPAFIKAFREGDESRAYEIIRERDPFPELTARLSPAWLESEGACIETTLTGTPVPILDLQYVIAWRARDSGRTGARIPPETTGKRIAIIGAGPSGLAAAIRLIELGHTVALYEQSDRLGGVPTRLLAATRSTIDPQAEIAAILRPALAAERLRLHFGATLGQDVSLDELRANHAAVLVATGLWQEPSLGHARGVIGALKFLESRHSSAPNRVAILAGGDTAMDAARLAQNRGAKEIFIIFGGPRSAMHWHMPESWFATPGVQAMMSWQPLGYETNPDGQLTGVRLRHTDLCLETVLPVDLVIEAMSLQVADPVRAVLAPATEPVTAAGSPLSFVLRPLPFVYVAGAVANGGASVSQCAAEGLAAAAAIHRDLSP